MFQKVKKVSKMISFHYMKVVMPSTASRHNKMFFSTPPTMSFGFLDVIFGENGLEIDTDKTPNFF